MAGFASSGKIFRAVQTMATVSPFFKKRWYFHFFCEYEFNVRKSISIKVTHAIYL